MIAVTVPARNEQARIAGCLRSLWAAARHPALQGEEVRLYVALDRCEDRTGEIARSLGARTLEVSGGVGAARAAAAGLALQQGARWLAITDADTTVPRDWLSAQLGCQADVFCGVVRVRDWRGYSPLIRHAFAELERAVDGHGHVHGANLGVSARAYRASGGFASLSTGEDVALVEALAAQGWPIARKGKPAVYTSARRVGRAREGFAAYLVNLESRLTTGCDAVTASE